MNLMKVSKKELVELLLIEKKKNKIIKNKYKKLLDLTKALTATVVLFLLIAALLNYI